MHIAAGMNETTTSHITRRNLKNLRQNVGVRRDAIRRVVRVTFDSWLTCSVSARPVPVTKLRSKQTIAGR